MHRRLAGKTAIVTGAGTGIGQEIAIRLGCEGAKVLIDYIGESEGAETTRRKIEEAGGVAETVQADVTKGKEILNLIDVAWGHFGSADILVNNAGVEQKAAFWDTTETDYDRVLNVNLRGPFFLTKEFVCRLRDAKRVGRIVNISSVHEDMAFPGFTSYCCSKGALRMFTRNLAVELGPLGITINNVAPGAIATPINQSLLEDKSKLDALLEKIPLGRMGSTRDVAGVVAFLASDDAAYITGSTLIVDGGLIRDYHEQ